MNGVQTRFKCKLDVKRCKRFVFPPSSLLPRSNALKTKAIRYFQTDRTLTRIVSPPLRKLETHFYVFAVRCLDQWLSWEEVKFYAALFDLPTVPELRVETVERLTREALQQQVVSLAQEPGVFGTRDPQTGADCTREGVVTRNIGEYPVSEFARNVFKYVRKGHVKTDEHWTRNWKRARLIWEIGKEE